MGLRIQEGELQEVIEEAKRIANNCYSPYSKIRVVACLVCDEGKFWGVNVENASYGLTICAERSAIASAISNGAKKFLWMLIYSPDIIPIPCGACRQVIAEFVDGDFPIIVATGKEKISIYKYRLIELFPHSFCIQKNHRHV